jgi:hypothetical protein
LAACTPVDSDAKIAAVSVTPPARRSMLGAILTDIHFWVPVVVLVIGLGLLMFLS